MLQSYSELGNGSKVSDKYQHVTSEVLGNALIERGYALRQVKGRAGQYAKHVAIVSKAGAAFAIGPRKDLIIPEIHITNSHDGTSSLRLQLGLFRRVCSNGLTVPHGLINTIRLQHRGKRDLISAALTEVDKLLSAQDIAMKKAERWSNIVLENSGDLLLFSRLAQSVRQTPAVLGYRARRLEDMSHDLWTVLNRAQEAAVQGQRSGRYNGGPAVRALTSAEAVNAVNVGLWHVAEIVDNAITGTPLASN
jgi:hypothetical protein